MMSMSVSAESEDDANIKDCNVSQPEPDDPPSSVQGLRVETETVGQSSSRSSQVEQIMMKSVNNMLESNRIILLSKVQLLYIEGKIYT